MAKKLDQEISLIGGISDSLKSKQQGVFAFGAGIDFRSDPFQYTINPRNEQQAGSLIADLPMWADLACDNLYFYGNTGNLYLKNSSDVWSIDHLVPNSVGNGLAFFPEDEYLYYAQSKTIGRKSRACGTDGEYYDGFLESEGGEPTNTQSITFVAASSQYASIADNASLSITDDISMETYIKFTTLPSMGEVQTFISKWNEQANQRSYKFDLTTSSNAFGDGRDGALTISSNTTEDPIDANCAGTSGQYTLTITNAHASFASVAAGDKVLIHQTRGSGSGTRQFATVSSYSGGVLTLQEALTFSPVHSATSTVAEKAQVRVIKQHTTVTINNGITYSAKSWNGLKGGISYFYANVSFTNNGTWTAEGKGFNQNGLKNIATGDPGFGGQGEGSAGLGITPPTAVHGGDYAARLANGTGGGAGVDLQNTASAGGGYAFVGTNGNNNNAGQSSLAIGGIAIGEANLTTFHFGGQGGGTGMGGGFDPNTYYGSTGGNGGGILGFWAPTVTNSGTITVNGSNGTTGNAPDCPGAGGGAGGTIDGHFVTATLGTTTANGGSGSTGTSPKNRHGGAGSVGRCAFYYATSYIGNSTPTATFIQDSTLAATNGYVLRLLLSSNGTNSEIYSTDVTNIIQTDVWYRWAVTWDAPTSSANFYQNAALLSTQTGSFTQIYNSTARFAIATSYDSSGVAHDFLNAKMDDTRVWNSVRSQLELSYYNDRVLVGTETNNSAYYKFEGNLNDSQTYTATSNLTGTNGPTYSTDVPFAGITTRLDQDININAVGSTYTMGTAVSESPSDRQTFQPTKEPIKSVQLNINTVGTGNWTVVIHDALNREIASITVPNAQLQVGYYEFIFPDSFRPILTANYHVHVYSTVGDGKIVTSSLNDMEGTTGDTGAYFATFYQILVDDIYHPMTQFQNFLVIGNERYVAKLEAGNLYNPHQITLPAGYRVRCFAKWNEFLAIGVWKGDSITDTDQGKIFLWDGGTDTSGSSNVNTIVDVLEGGVNAMQGAAGILYIISGYEGKLSLYGGGATQKVTQIPLLKRDEYCETAPGAMTMWRSILRFGSTLNTDSSTVHQGVYGYGRLNINYPNALGFDFPLSLGDQTSNAVRIGCVFPAGQSLYTGWQNGNQFGIDKVSVTNDCYAAATVEHCIMDGRRMSQKKLPLVYRVDFEPLTDGQAVAVYEKKDRESSWNLLDIEDTVGATDLRTILHAQVKEIQLKEVVTSTSGETPVIIQAGLENDDQGDTIVA
jgi:hypothetical protein